MQSRMGHRHSNAAEKSEVSAGALVSKKLFVLTLALFAVMALMPATAWGARQSIQSIETASLSDSVKVTVSASMPLSLHGSRLGSNYVVVDLYGSLAAKPKTVQINSGGIKSVKYGWYKSDPPVVRLVVATKNHRPYSVSYENGKRTAFIVVQKEGSASPEVAVQGTKEEASFAEIPAPDAVSTLAIPDETTPVTASSSKVVRIAAAQPEYLKPAEAKVSRPIRVASAKPIAVEAAPVMAVAAPANEPKISLDFVASDIHDVVKALAVQSGENIVASPDVKGNVTVSLNKVTVEEALKLVANLSGYQFRKVEGTYVVGTPENLRSLAGGGLSPDDEKVTDVVILQHSDPAVVTQLLEKEFGMVQVSLGGDSKDGKVNGSSFIALTGTRANVAAAKIMVSTIEQAMADASAGATIEPYEVMYADITELPSLVMSTVPGLLCTIGPNQGFNLRRPEAVAVEVSGAIVPGAAETEKAPSKMLLLQGSPEAIAKAKEILAKVDVPHPQIVIEAKIVDITDSGAKDLGIDWGGEFGTLSTFSMREDRSITDNVPATRINNILRSPLGFDASIKAIVQSGKGKILANPNSLAIDGKPSSIFIGDEIKYVTRVDETASGVTVTTETARVGVQLHSISRISSDGYITMSLHPEVSVIVEWKQLPAVGLALPQISRRFVDSTVRVKDGETIAIGGLIKEEDIKTMSGIPILKDLPIIGSLFRYESTSNARSEIMMFITPRIVSPAE